ncbi:DUF6173 family protein [Jannaschia sp. W003]|uniref:DUF6173 family protein n=1 Tax=Jannaschia sp. W003 TaxID=2867012 RepID=UPI0021A7E945|nr:DUF6173 family protein [Jannaschia sp. W003]UWQ22728.1 DUF6173 family protein [Jannaschia sp. W003]
MDSTPSTTAEAMEAHALNRAVDAEGRDTAPPVPAPSKRPVSPAEWACKRLVLYIKAFEERLDAEHEAAMGFAGGPGGAQGLLRIEGVGFSAPDLVTFSGRDGTGVPSTLVQHVSQLNVVMRAVPRPPENSEARRIGFRLARALEAEEVAEEEAVGDRDAESA